MNPAITAAIVAANAKANASLETVIARLRKDKALRSDSAVRFEPANEAEQKFLDEAIGRGLVVRRHDGLYYINERAVSERNEGLGFAALLMLLAIASVVASVIALVKFAAN